MRLCERVNASVAPSVAKRNAAQIYVGAQKLERYAADRRRAIRICAAAGRKASQLRWRGAAHDAALCGWPVLLALLWQIMSARWPEPHLWRDPDALSPGRSAGEC
jgi:hypothetical protein